MGREREDIMKSGRERKEKEMGREGKEKPGKVFVEEMKWGGKIWSGETETETER